MLALNSPPSADYLVEKAWEVLSDFMTLSSNEVEFIDLIERGELRPDLLFLYDPQAVRSISEHPAILWKIANVRSHLHKKGESG